MIRIKKYKNKMNIFSIIILYSFLTHKLEYEFKKNYI